MAPAWKWDAQDYARSSSAQSSWAVPLVESLALRGTESVIDIGCGDGKITAEIARRVPDGSVLGVDSSPEMIELARATYPRAQHPNLVFEVADARSLAWSDRFDIAFSNAALHWVVGHGDVLAGVARLLRRGGRALFQMGGRGNAAEVVTVVQEMMTDPVWEPFFRGFVFPWGFYGPEEYQAWCSAAGLRVDRLELVPREMRQSGVDGLVAWLRTTWMPFTARLPVDRREEFLREAAARYVALHPVNEAGEVVVRMVRLELDARRI